MNAQESLARAKSRLGSIQTFTSLTKFMSSKYRRIGGEVCLTVLLAVFAAALFKGMESGHRIANRQFKLTDTNLLHPYINKQTFSSKWFVLAWFIFAAIMFSLDYIRYRTFKNPFITAWTFIQLIVINLLFTTIGKVMFARLRPDFIDRCFGLANIDKADFTAPAIIGGWYSTSQCLEPFSKLVTDGRVSFPSGHSSLATVFATVFSFYLFFYWRKRIFFSGILTLISAAWCWAIWVMASRTFDYRHHPGDIIGGALLGFVVGAVFPHLSEINRSWIFSNDYQIIPDVAETEILIEK